MLTAPTSPEVNNQKRTPAAKRAQADVSIVVGACACGFFAENHAGRSRLETHDSPNAQQKHAAENNLLLRASLA